MTQLDKPQYEPKIQIINGVRFITTTNELVVPIFNVGLYKAVGLIPDELPDFELTEEETLALAESEAYQADRKIIRNYIDEFRPGSFQDIENFIQEMLPYLEKYNFDIGDLRISLQNKIFAPIQHGYTASDPDMYLLYKSIGLNVVWTGEGEPPVAEA